MTAPVGEQPESEAAARPIRGARAYWVLLALIAGLAIGAVAQGMGDGLREPALKGATIIGGLWLNALKMTVIPLVVSLLVVGIAKGAEAARAGRIAARSVLWFVAIVTSSAIFGALLMPVLLRLLPLSAASAEALRTGLAAIDPAAASGTVPAVADFFATVIPSNVAFAASNGDVLPLTVFALLLGLALARVAPSRRAPVVAFFEGLGEALLIIIGWVLWVAPLGVFALAFAVGSGAGAAAFAGLAHYILLVSALGVLIMLAGYAVAVIGGGVSPLAFAKAMIGPQAVAISTQSSLASLPAMLGATRLLDVDERVADVTLPLSVALFRATGPAMNIGVVIYVAHWLGTDVSLGHAIAAVAVASIVSYGAVSLPGQISFFSSIAPISMAMGVPIAPLALLVAVEMIPDIFRTLGNVTMDVAVTTAVDRHARNSTAAA
ncbi:MAG: cation:dicarboxylase symporter family transporter [Sphingomicrobium sp.]